MRMGRGGRGGGGFRGGAQQGPSGRQLRKERRKEERVASKKRAAPLVPNFEGHDSEVRATRRRVELFVESLRRSIAKEEERLKAWKPPKTPEQLEAERLKKRGSGLRGAAKPAWERYPELYPEMHKPEEPEPTFDLLEKHTPNCFSNEETKGLVGLYYQLGFAILADDKNKLRGKEAQNAFKSCLTLDKSDPFGARYGFLLASLERGQVVEEWEEILKAEFLDGTSDQLFIRALISHIQEAPDAEEKLAEAVNAFPESSLALLNGPILSAFVDHGQVLAWVRDERERLVSEATAKGQPSRTLSLCDLGLCPSPEARAVLQYVCFGSLWEDESVRQALQRAGKGIFYEPGVDEDDEDNQKEKDGEAWLDAALTRLYRKASYKFAIVADDEDEQEHVDSDDDEIDHNEQNGDDEEEENSDSDEDESD